MTISNIDPSFIDVAQILKTSFAKIGAQMDIQIVDNATWSRLNSRMRALDMSLMNFVPTLDVNSNSHTFYSKTALAYYEMNDSKLDAMLERWRSTVDPEEQIGISHQIQRHIAEMAYYPALAGSPFFQATRDRVKGWKFMNKLVFDLKDVWLDR